MPVVEIPELTPREIEVGRALAKGMTYNQVAAELGISPHTVSMHTRMLRTKLKAENTVQVVNALNLRGLI